MNIRNKKSRVIHENPYYKYCHDSFETETGDQGNYYYAHTRGAAMVVPVTGDGRLLLVRQYRYLMERNSIEFPCGGILESDKSAQDAAQRELLEETGYRAGQIIKVGEFEPANGYCRDKTSVFIAKDLEYVCEPNSSTVEEITELMTRRPHEIDEMIADGEIFCGQTMASWAITNQMIF